MKGRLIKTEEGWMVGTVCYADIWSELLPLHPADVEQINRDAQVFDNIEARIAAYPEVEFEVEKFGEAGMEVVFAKLTKTKEPKQENCCTPVGQIKRYVDCIGCDRKPKQETLEETAKNAYKKHSVMDKLKETK